MRDISENIHSLILTKVDADTANEYARNIHDVIISFDSVLDEISQIYNSVKLATYISAKDNARIQELIRIALDLYYRVTEKLKNFCSILNARTTKKYSISFHKFNDMLLPARGTSVHNIEGIYNFEKADGSDFTCCDTSYSRYEGECTKINVILRENDKTTTLVKEIYDLIRDFRTSIMYSLSRFEEYMKTIN